MRWPWRRRRNDSGRVVFIGSSPFGVAQVVSAFPTRSPAVSAWVPDAPPVPVVAVAAPEAQAPPAVEPPPAPPPVPPPGPAPVPAAPVALAAAPAAEPRAEPRAGVQLGFADGSVMTLADDDPRAVALRAVAARLTGTA